MQESKRHLKMISTDNKQNNVVEGTTCFAIQAKHNVNCQRQNCQHWIASAEFNNCVVLASREGPHTLQKIGQIYGLSRMRICQVEKEIFERIRQLS